MDRARIHEGVRRMRFADVLGRTERSELSQMAATELLEISERTFRRWRERYREEGPAVCPIVGFGHRCVGTEGGDRADAGSIP